MELGKPYHQSKNIAARLAGFIRGAFFVGLVLAVGYVAIAWVWSVV